MNEIENPETVTLSEIGDEITGTVARAPLLFVALEAANLESPPARHCLLNIDEVRIGRGARRTQRLYKDSKRLLIIQLPDRAVSSDHARIMVSASAGSCVLVDRQSKNGTLLNGARCATSPLADGDVIEIGQTSFLFRGPRDLRVADCMDVNAAEMGGPFALKTLIPSLAQQLEGLVKIAASGRAVLLQGETGTGKERVALAVHDLSGARGDFVAINCGALTDTLLEGELFGYKKGAFSGADRDRVGLITSADGGTLFLDEIAELAPKGQAALLRVLQEHEVRPLGATRAIPIDLRVVVATHRDLEQRVARGSFREDLYARIADYVLHLPPLRDRREDLGLLVRNMLLDGILPGEELRLTPGAARALLRHDWPRNIRELEKALASAAVLTDDGLIRIEHLPDTLRLAGIADDLLAPPPSLAGPRPPRPRFASAPLITPPHGIRTLASALTPARGVARPFSDEDIRRRELIMSLLEEHDGNVSRVAAAMGKHRQQIQKWLKRYRLDAARYRKA